MAKTLKALLHLGGYLADAEFEWAKEKLILLLTPGSPPAPVSIGRVGCKYDNESAAAGGRRGGKGRREGV